MSKNKIRYIPIIIAVSIVVGIFIGTFYAKRFTDPRQQIGTIAPTSNKLNGLLRIINDQYVDTVNMKDLIEDVMPQVLGELDPHSSYIPAKDLQAVNEELKGSFSGIGIQFSIEQDTIHISNVIPGGPSEKVGLMPGDRIVEIDDSAFVGKIVTDIESKKRLKGPKGTEVKLGVFRHGEKELLHFTIIRGDIPVKSIDASYMLNEKYGYIKIEKFAETTYAEMLIALARLHQENCEGVVIDLRGNTGGYLEVAFQMVNEFLPKDKLIVYTEGRKFPRKDYFSNGTGSSQQTPIIVLLDEWSASASEIFAGAIQDNDRGTIIGRRSFGKGLVQQPIEFNDGSAIRLTIARYYTPSGRCIQKPYVKGKDENYEMDIITRYEHGEFFSQDSIMQDESQIYYTSLGRPVYGGGGIMPDIFVPQDTIGYTSYFRMAINQNLTLKFAFQYTDQNRQTLKIYENADDLLKYLKTQNILEKFARFAESKGLKRRNILMYKSKELFDRNLYGYIIYNMLNMEEYVKFINKHDKTVQKALEVLEAEKAFPNAPEEKSEANHEGTETTVA